MKKLVFLLVAMVFAYSTNAQWLYINNSSYVDLEIILYAADATGCGPGPDDQSNTIVVNSGNSVSYNFSGGTGATGFHWASQANPGDPSSNFPSGYFNFFMADVGTVCAGPGSHGTCNGGLDLDGTRVFNDMGIGGTPCGAPTVSYFLTDGCSPCSHMVMNCCPPGGCPGNCVSVGPQQPGTVTLTMVSGDWYLNITN